MSDWGHYMKTKTQRHVLSLRGDSNLTLVPYTTEASVGKMHPAVSFISVQTIPFTVILPVFALSFINVPVGASTHFATFIFEQIFYSLSLGRQLCFEVVIHFNP